MWWLSLGKLGLRSAARDIAIERENYRFCFPIVTWLVVSVVAPLIFRVNDGAQHHLSLVGR